MTITHPDPAKMQEALEAWNSGGFLEHFFPVPYTLRPENLSPMDWEKFPNAEYGRELDQAIRALNKKHFGYESWYEWRLVHWGIKWDIGHGSDDGKMPALKDNVLSVNFNSPWGPPLDAYSRLQELGYEIKAYYWESGMCFAGIWDNGIDEYYSDITDSANARATLPGELDEIMGISETLEAYEEEIE
jgi:hypothetical protein